MICDDGVFLKAVPTVFLKSQFEYGRGNYEKAVRMLSSTAGHVLGASSSTPVRGPLRNAAAMYFNNVGLAHFHLRKHNLGAFYLRRAAEENMKTVREAHGHDGILDVVSVIFTGMPVCSLVHVSHNFHQVTPPDCHLCKHQII